MKFLTRHKTIFGILGTAFLLWAVYRIALFSLMSSVHIDERQLGPYYFVAAPTSEDSLELPSALAMLCPRALSPGTVIRLFEIEIHSQSTERKPELLAALSFSGDQYSTLLRSHAHDSLRFFSIRRQLMVVGEVQMKSPRGLQNLLSTVLSGAKAGTLFGKVIHTAQEHGKRRPGLFIQILTDGHITALAPLEPNEAEHHEQ